MLITSQALFGCSIEAADGQVGTVEDLYFDDRTWAVRYLVVDTGNWLPGRKVLLSPEIVKEQDWPARRLVTGLTREKVENSPPVETDLPVSRQKEIEMAQYFAWGAYWAGQEGIFDVEGDPNLRSARHVAGYRIEAADGEIGHVEEFIFDDASWQGAAWEIRYLVIDTRNWLPGRKVLILPRWAKAIDWGQRRVRVEVDRWTIQASPEYDPATPINRQYEEVLYDYYGWPKYWGRAKQPH
jgi:hypothetical protein